MPPSSQTSATFLSSLQPQLKHAIKTGIAAVLAAACHDALPFMRNVTAAWAAASAIIVMQSNLGSSWKAAGGRLIGTIIGGTIGACVAELGGTGLGWFGVVVSGTALVCSMLGLKDALRVAGVTLALVLLSRMDISPWLVGVQRSLDIILGIVAALGVQLLIWPARADTDLRQELSLALSGCGNLYAAATAGCLDGKSAASLDDLRSGAEDRIARLRSLVEDLNNEPLPNRDGDETLVRLVDQLDEVSRHVSAVDYAASQMTHDAYVHQLDQPLRDLARTTAATFDWLALALISRTEHGTPPDLARALAAAKTAYLELRKTRVSGNYGDDEILRFCTFFFSMQAVSEGMQRMMTAAAKV